MSGTTTPKLADVERLTHELQQEHRGIHEAVEELRAALPGDDMLGMLDRLHALLVRHFAHETYPGGFYEALGACAPQYRNDLRILVDEHFLLVTAVHGLRERLRHRHAQQELDLRPEVAEVIGRLQHHEDHENDLVKRLRA